jgi:EmrB/QacA subfamily drug resistance transporter
MANTLPDPRRWWALALLSLAQFIVILDTSIVGVALPAIQEALGVSQSSLQWVFNAYVIAFGGLLLLGGRLADIFGQRRLFMAGFAVLTAASILAGFAESDTVLFTGRALQGFGAALIAPAALSLVMGLFGSNPRELGKALGIWGASAAAGGTAGVFLGGVITEWLSWRWTFLINVPLGIAVLVLAPIILHAGHTRRGRIDIAGTIAITGALVAAVYAIVTANDAGWTSAQTLGLLTGSALLLIAFVAIEAARREPLVPLSIFRAPNLTAGNTLMALLGAAWIPLWFFLNLYLQQVLGYGAFESGLALLPMTVAIMLLMVGATARLIARYGPKANLVVGLALLAGSLGLFALTPTNGSFLLHVLPASLIAALGMSLSYIPAMITATASAKPEEMGLASGLVNTTYQVGSALGLAVMTALATQITSDRAGEGASQLSALNSGFHAAFIGAAIVAAGGALLTLTWLQQSRAATAPVSTLDPATTERRAA